MRYAVALALVLLVGVSADAGQKRKLCIAACMPMIEACTDAAAHMGFGDLERGCRKAILKQCKRRGPGVCDEYCGNGVAGLGEACDGVDLAGRTCESIGFASGTLGCALGCSLDTSGCVGADTVNADDPLVIGAPENELVGEKPALRRHLDQADVDAGGLTLTEIFRHGQQIFGAVFNILDGQGRPASTGDGAPRRADEPAFIRTSGPDSNSCAGCHAQPRAGGAGDFVANVFVLAQTLDPVTESVSAALSNERNTLGMMGAGAIEMLAREMSNELIAIREEARDTAASTGAAQTRTLVAKGVHFGSITVLPNGRVDPTEIEGVDWDLIIKPFHQKGAVVSLREFTNNAMNHHHGMQSTERFGAGEDADDDGVVDELTVGDITAVTVFQAALNVPGRRLPSDPIAQAAVATGEARFAQVGCASCHVPAFTLESRLFTEPNPFNPPGNLRPEDVSRVLSWDMTSAGERPRLARVGTTQARVRPFTDLKRHDLNDDDFDHFDNEQVPQGALNGFANPSDFTISPTPRPTGEFLTRKLWDAGNSAPYGHRGDLTTLTEAIYFHGGDARASRDAFFALAQGDQDAIIEFLSSLQVLPPQSGGTATTSTTIVDSITTTTVEVPDTTTTSLIGTVTTTTVADAATTTTTSAPDALVPVEWNFQVRIARTAGSDTNVAVPYRSGEVVVAEIRADALEVFRVGRNTGPSEMDDDTLARLLAAAEAHIVSHPDDYADFDHVVQLNSAKRMN